MPVRIIFRGLILFRFPETDDDAGKLVAELINKPSIARRPKKATANKPPRGPHEHRHDAQIQIATDHGVGDKLAPVDLIGRQGNAAGERIDITFLDADDNSLDAERVVQDQSFLDHVPRLSDVIDAGTPAVRAMKTNRGSRDNRLIRNTVTVNRGRIRVREVVTWDEGGFPLKGEQGQRGLVPASPAHLKFVGSDVHGFLASEFVVDVDASGVDVQSSKPNKKLKKRHKKGSSLNHRVPYDTVEILISNFEYQEDSALPWGLDFQWLFEAAGYPAVDLAGQNLNEFHGLGTQFNLGIYENERSMLLDLVDANGRIVPGKGPIDDHRGGRPFPYVAKVSQLDHVKKQPLNSTEEEYRPICIGGFEEGGG